MIGKVNFLRRFIVNLARKMKVFSPLLKLKNNKKMVRGEEKQIAFKLIKQALANPHVLVPSMLGRPLKLYISVVKESIGYLLS